MNYKKCTHEVWKFSPFGRFYKYVYPKFQVCRPPTKKGMKGSKVRYFVSYIVQQCCSRLLLDQTIALPYYHIDPCLNLFLNSLISQPLQISCNQRCRRGRLYRPIIDLANPTISHTLRVATMLCLHLKYNLNMEKSFQ